jgi:predicted nucleic acid-binding protein
MLVLDTSALLAVLVEREPDPELVRRLSDDGDLHAPHLIDVEVLHALRRMVRAGRITADRAADARTDLGDLAITRYGHEALSDRIWALRDNLTAYDATFVALAETLDVALVTCDERLARAPGVTAEVYPL